jgi:hypothetical protein
MYEIGLSLPICRTGKIVIPASMDAYSDGEILLSAGAMLVACGLLSPAEAARLLTDNSCTRLSSDGSTRRFWRLQRTGRNLCIIAAPSGSSKVELAEAKAAWHIGKHLSARGVPVPEVFAWDEERGILLFEDLGDLRLYDVVAAQDSSPRRDTGVMLSYYRKTLKQLAAMQVLAVEGFDPGWCYDGPLYDVSLMLERESGYFLRAFWQGFLGQEDPAGVAEEFRHLAEQAGRAPTDFFLHRDFQSRNIMIAGENVRFIDFQAGRFGPLGYDVASLLIDPYVTLAEGMQEELLGYYLTVLAASRPGSERDFLKYYPLLAVQRNLQIVAAFAFLSKVRGKVFFRDFIGPALISLRSRLAESSFTEYHHLRGLVDRSLKLLSVY